MDQSSGNLLDLLGLGEDLLGPTMAERRTAVERPVFDASGATDMHMVEPFDARLSARLRTPRNRHSMLTLIGQTLLCAAPPAASRWKKSPAPCGTRPGLERLYARLEKVVVALILTEILLLIGQIVLWRH